MHLLTCATVHSDIASVKDDVKYTRSRLSLKEDLKILDWLTYTDYGRQQTDHFKRRQPGTGQWFLNSQEYESWAEEPRKTLFCPGMPGVGKTILTSIIVNDLEEKFPNPEVAAIVYIYCDFNRGDEQSIENLFSSLLKQLAQSQRHLPVPVRELYEKHRSKRTGPTLDEIYDVLQSVALKIPRVFIIIDALDEYLTSAGCRMKFLSEVFRLQSTTQASILATSRSIPEIAKRFEGSVSVEIRAKDDDIRRYLEDRIPELPSIVSRRRDLQVRIVTNITKAADGMYVESSADLADSS